MTFSVFRPILLIISQDEESRLLFEDPNNLNYGAFNDAEPGTPQTDAQDTQRENEALQKIVAQTSKYVISYSVSVGHN